MAATSSSRGRPRRRSCSAARSRRRQWVTGAASRITRTPSSPRSRLENVRIENAGGFSNGSDILHRATLPDPIDAAIRLHASTSLPRGAVDRRRGDRWLGGRRPRVHVPALALPDDRLRRPRERHCSWRASCSATATVRDRSCASRRAPLDERKNRRSHEPRADEMDDDCSLDDRREPARPAAPRIADARADAARRSTRPS